MITDKTAADVDLVRQNIEDVNIYQDPRIRKLIQNELDAIEGKARKQPTSSPKRDTLKVAA